MPGTPTTLADLGDSLPYRRRADGSLQYDGHRPGRGWRAHGYFPCTLILVEDGQAIERRVYKRRWLDPRTGRTTHSRPPDQLGRLRFCALIAFAELHGWLDGDAGVLTRRPIATLTPSPRTLQRWLRRLLPHAEAIQTALRRAVIERAEPRPIEHLFPTGLSPPKGGGRRWRNPEQLITLHRGLTIAAAGSRALMTPLAALLAEARERYEDTRQPARDEPTATA